MPKIIIDGREVECRAGIPVLQAALEAGWNILLMKVTQGAGTRVLASGQSCSQSGSEEITSGSWCEDTRKSTLPMGICRESAAT